MTKLDFGLSGERSTLVHKCRVIVAGSLGSLKRTTYYVLCLTVIDISASI